MTDDLRAKLIEVLDQPSKAWFGMVRKNPADEAIPLAVKRLGEARAIAEDLARHHASTRVRVHALQLWPRLCIFDPAAGAGTARPLLGEDRLHTFRPVALELTKDPDAEVRAAAAIQLLTLSEAGMLGELRAQLAPIAADIQAHDDQWMAEDALRLLAGPTGATAIVRRALTTDPPILDEELAAAVRSLIDAPDPAAAAALAKLYAALPVDAAADPAAPRDTVLAWLACTSPGSVDGVVAMIARAAPRTAVQIITPWPEHGAAGAAALAAIARARTLPLPARVIGIAGLARAARLHDDVKPIAIAVATELAAEPALAANARQLTIELSTIPS